MGCAYYGADVEQQPGKWGRCSVHFNESSEEVCCLCTFPHNDGDTLGVERVRALAYLGAMIALLHQGEVSAPLTQTGHGRREVAHIPDDLPEWIRREIDRHLKEKP